MNNEQIETEIQAKGLTAPRVTPSRIEDVIVEQAYYTFPGTTVTICLLTLVNGFSVTGESACASVENFDLELGQRIARAKAADKIWSLEAYLIKQEAYDRAANKGV